MVPLRPRAYHQGRSSAPAGRPVAGPRRLVGPTCQHAAPEGTRRICHKGQLPSQARQRHGGRGLHVDLAQDGRRGPDHPGSAPEKATASRTPLRRARERSFASRCPDRDRIRARGRRHPIDGRWTTRLPGRPGPPGSGPTVRTTVPPPPLDESAHAHLSAARPRGEPSPVRFATATTTGTPRLHVRPSVEPRRRGRTSPTARHAEDGYGRASA